MAASAERNALLSYYGKSSGFGQKILKMSDSQIIAIYLRLKGKGVLK